MNKLRKNRLAFYRRRMGFSQKRVAELLGHTRHGMLSSLECGESLPKLETALKLEIITRTPVAFLFPSLYDHLKSRIRGLEESGARPAGRHVTDHSSAERL